MENNILSKIIALDKTIHEPVRIAILTLLMVVEKADFIYLKSNLQITQGNLSSHLCKLETAGYVEIEKTFKGKRPLTLIKVTEEGEKNFKDYLLTIKSFIKQSGI
ncbi:MAG: transcriptional regulator [Prolixibacteraceae bacterium]|nr:transcriptional regulator [Prolixibacteraceae bacterium]MBN2774587.1 transcriptional regulator [Prolixibacteraceae bacterium]